MLVNGVISSWHHVTSAVPQGSVLGTVLFNAFVDDLYEGIKSTLSQFADQTPSWAGVLLEGWKALQRDLDRLDEVQQGECWVLQLVHNSLKQCYRLGEEQLANCPLEKDLGVLVSSH